MVRDKELWSKGRRAKRDRGVMRIAKGYRRMADAVDIIVHGGGTG